MRLRRMTIVAFWAGAAATGCGKDAGVAGGDLDGAIAEGSVDGPVADSKADSSDSAAGPEADGADGSLGDLDGGDEVASRDGGPDSTSSDSATYEGGGTPDAGTCVGLQTGPLPAGGDVTYAWSGVAKSPCVSRPFCAVSCEDGFLRDLLACNAVEGGYFWGQGSAYIRVFGRQGGSCVFDIGRETEGAVTFERCTAPLPVSPWPGLYAVDSPASSAAPNLLDGLSGCQVISTCNIMPGAPDPCDPGPTGPPTCPANSAGPC